MNDDNLKDILDAEKEVSVRVREEQEKFDFELMHYQNRLKDKISSLEEDLKQDLEKYKEDCRSELESKYEEKLKNFKSRNEKIKKMEFSFLEIIIKPYIREILD